MIGDSAGSGSDLILFGAVGKEPDPADEHTCLLPSNSPAHAGPGRTALVRDREAP